MGLKHFFHSTKTDPSDPTIIGATKWNDDHYYVDAAGAPVGNVGAVLLAGAAGALTHLNSVAAGQVLTSAGAGALPVWAAAAGGVPAALVADTLTLNLASADVVLRRSGPGALTLTNAAGTDFDMLRFGGTTGAFPALGRNGASMNLLTADGGGFTELVLGQIRLNPGNVIIMRGTGGPEGVAYAYVGSLYLRTDGGASTTLYVKQSGAGTNTGWVAK